jgi:hypothetical protein
LGINYLASILIKPDGSKLPGEHVEPGGDVLVAAPLDVELFSDVQCKPANLLALRTFEQQGNLTKKYIYNK